jgi:hypothetical protein
MFHVIRVMFVSLYRNSVLNFYSCERVDGMNALTFPIMFGERQKMGTPLSEYNKLDSIPHENGATNCCYIIHCYL